VIRDLAENVVPPLHRRRASIMELRSGVGCRLALRTTRRGGRTAAGAVALTFAAARSAFERESNDSPEVAICLLLPSMSRQRQAPDLSWKAANRAMGNLTAFGANPYVQMFAAGSAGTVRENIRR
jgi:hypothetical protein